MPVMPASRALVGRGAVVVLLAAALTPSTVPPAEAGDPGYCDQTTSGPVYTWVADDPGAWNSAANWEADGVAATEAPGYTETDAVVCIPSGAQVTLVHNDDESRGEAIIQTLDVAPGGDLTIAPTGRLYTSGTADDRSILRRSTGGDAGLLQLRGALGGDGELRVDGMLIFEHLAGHGAPAMTTRHCITFVTQPCHPGSQPDTEPVSAPGVTVVGDRGVLRVVGANGANLDDARVIDVRGRMEIIGPGYVAADNGTTIIVRPDAILEMQGRGNIYQGNAYFGQPRALVTLAGTTLRSGAAATSLIDTRVQLSATTEVRVKSGFLSLGGDVAPRGRVQYGASYGIGRCNSLGATCPIPEASASDPQAMSVSLPVGPSGSVPVMLVERPGERVAGDVAAPVRVHAEGVNATAAQPMVFRFRIDKTRVKGRAPASFDVRRRADGTVRYRLVPDCRNNGQPPAAAKSCVDVRRSIAGGDVLIVVRTQVSSRWKIRRGRVGS